MKLFDLHNDVLTAKTDVIKEIKGYPPFVTVVTAVYRENNLFFDIIGFLNTLEKLKDSNTFLAFEDVGYLGLDFNALSKLKPIYCSLTHNDENLLGYGVNENKPLKPMGLEAIEVFNENNISVDLSHLSIKGSLQAVQNAKKVMISHTAFNGVFKHKRNVSDGLIIDVISKGGIIGLTLVGYFLTLKSATIYDVIKHIDYFTSKFGEDNLCIGTDYNGTNYLPKGLTKYTHFITLKEELLKLGYKEETVNKIFYYNAYNYFSAK